MLRLSEHGVGKRFFNADWNKLDPNTYKVLFEYYENYKTYLNEGRGLVLSCPPGIGKTYATVALMKKLREEQDSRFDFFFITAPDLFDRLDDRRNTTDQYRQKSWLNVFGSVTALVINDLGKEDRSREWLAEAAVSKLGRVLRRRHEAQLPVFITTNLPLVPPKSNAAAQTFKTVYGESIWSLIYDMTVSRAQIHAPDLRQENSRV